MGVLNNFLRHLLRCLIQTNIWKNVSLLMELKHRAYQVIKKFKFYMQQVGSKRRLQLAEHEEIRKDAYENAKNYKQQMKVFHGKHIMRKSFTPSQKILLFDFHLHLFPDNLRYQWFSPFIVHTVFHIGLLKLRIQITMSLLKLMVRD